MAWALVWGDRATGNRVAAPVLGRGGALGNSSRALGDVTEKLWFVCYSFSYAMLEMDPGPFAHKAGALP